MTEKLIIEARLNEFASKRNNPNVPYSPNEIAAAAQAVCNEGAAIAHFHARDAEDGESEDFAEFSAIVSSIRAGCDILVYPTLGRFRHGTDPMSRLDNVRRLAAAPGLKPDIAPLDLGTNNIDLWDPVAKRITVGDVVYQNTAFSLMAMAAELRTLGIVPQLVLWSVSGIRLMRAMFESGHLTKPLYAGLLLSGDSMLFGHPASRAGLAAFTSLMGDLPVHWTVMINGDSFFPLLPHILEAGGHVALGLGDFPYAADGHPSNAALVRRVAKAAAEAGRALASPDEARRMLGCRQLAAA